MADHKMKPRPVYPRPGLTSLRRLMPHYGALATLQDAVSDRDGAAKAREILTAIKATTKTKSLAMCRSDTTPKYVASFVPMPSTKCGTSGGARLKARMRLKSTTQMAGGVGYSRDFGENITVFALRVGGVL